MAFTFKDIIDETKERANRNESGTQFDNTIKNTINTSLFRLARESNWKSLRRKTTINTETEYSTGSGAVTVTNNSKDVTVTGATFITNGLEVDRRVDLGGSSKQFIIASITGETTFTVDKLFDGTTSSTQTYKIYGKEEYVLPPQTGNVVAVWHENFGYPYLLNYVPDLDMIKSGIAQNNSATPTYYRMNSADMSIQQPNEASVVSVASSSSNDTSINITVFGIVSGYPDRDTITTNGSNGTTSVNGSKSFSSIERIVKNASSIGRITASTNSGNVTISVLPAGDTTSGILYQKIQVFPMPNEIFPINIHHYKQPWRMVNDDDVHELGQDFDEAIICITVAKIKYQNSQSEGDKWFSLYKDELKNLKKVNADKIDWLATLKRERDTSNRDLLMGGRISYGQMGGNFGPSGRIR